MRLVLSEYFKVLFYEILFFFKFISIILKQKKNINYKFMLSEYKIYGRKNKSSDIRSPKKRAICFR